ncbi:type II secretion system protein N [Brevundimonas sp.]|uniref:type II secretion system protein N n=1 Tax=Brevundimonas sp. TaxID=1871086 RepID=UPI0040340D6B
MISGLRNIAVRAGTRVAPVAGRLNAPLVATVVLSLLLAVQAGRLVWLFVEPAPEAPQAAARPMPEADVSIFQRFDAFFRTGTQSSLAEVTGADATQMRLYGVRAGGPGGGSAIIGLSDGRQVSVGIGEEVKPGLVLQSVGSDHVLLARGGSVSRLIFTEAPPGTPAPPAAPATPQVVTPQASAPATTPAAAPQVDPARLVAQAGLRPRLKGLGVSGFTVTSTGDGGALRAAGLRSGDVILAVNGSELNSPQAIAGLRNRLSGATSAEIRYERDGAVQTTTIRTAQ